MSVDVVNLAPLWAAIIVAAVSGWMFWRVHRDPKTPVESGLQGAPAVRQGNL